MHSTAECCAPVWCRSTHTHLNDTTINDALPIVAACLRPTSVDNLPTLAGIQPAELRRDGATLPPARRAMEPGHLLHSALTRPSTANARRLTSRHVPAAQHLISGRIANGMWSGRKVPQDSAFLFPTRVLVRQPWNTNVGHGYPGNMRSFTWNYVSARRCAFNSSVASFFVCDL